MDGSVTINLATFRQESTAARFGPTFTCRTVPWSGHSLMTNGPPPAAGAQVPTTKPPDPSPAPPLLPRIAIGDHTAVRECIERYGRLILAIAYRFLGHTGDAEDAVQDTFIELWKHAGRFDPRQGPELAFITTIARRRLIDGRRKAGRRPSAAPLPESLPERNEPRECPFDSADEVVKARAALAELKDEQRSVILMAVNEGLSHGEIATRTGLPLGTVKTHIRRGLLSVRKRLTAGKGDRS